jgi:transcriptional regulator with XRE-family HTH domain
LNKEDGSVQLKDYLEETGMSASDFARWIGVAPSLVSKWLEEDFEKRVIPGKKHMMTIRIRTNYRITADSFYPPAPTLRQRTQAAADDAKSLFVEYIKAEVSEAEDKIKKSRGAR